MAIPSSLPTGWFNYSPNQKAIWFMDNGVTPDDMRQVGVPESDINALMQFGYDAARAASVDQQNKLTSEEAARREAEMLRIIEQQKIEEQRQAEQQRLATIAAQEAARQEALRQEAARLAAAEAARQESIRVAAEQEAARQEAVRQEAARQEAARQEAARQEAVRVAAQEQARAAAAEQERLIQQQIAAQQEAARQEAARVAAQKPIDPITRLSSQVVEYLDPNFSGNAWNYLGGQSFVNQIASRVNTIAGVDDINDLELTTKIVPVTYNVEKNYDENGNSIFLAYTGEDRSRVLTPEETKNLKAETVYVPGQKNLDTGEDYFYIKYTLDTTAPKKGIYNKKTGKEVFSEPLGQGRFITLGGWGEGDGMTYANLRFDANGKPIIETWGKDKNIAKDILPVISIALMAIPGIGQAVGAALLPTGVSTAVATAVGNAVINAGIQVASGVPVEKAIVNSAASLGVSQLVPNLTGNVYVDNAVKAVATASLTGGDVGNALANSLIATGANDLLGNASFTGDKVVDSAIASAITSGVQAAATDGDVGASMLRGAASGASGQIAKEERAAESAKSGAGFIGEDVTEPTNVAQPDIDPRILAQGVAGGNFGEGGLLQTGGNISSNVLPPNPQSEFGVQKNINARADFNESSLGAKYGEINSPHWGKLISSIMINDVVDSNGNPINTPIGYYAIYDPDTKSTFYEFSLSDGTTVTSKTRPFVEQGKIFSEDKFFELKPSRQPSELNIDTGAGNGAFLGGTEDLVKDPDAGITISAAKPIIDQRLLDLVEQAPDQESATNATVAYYQALDNDLSDDEALNAAKTAMQAKSPQILFEDSVVEQKPTEQKVSDAGLTVVGQPVNQTPVVSSTTPSVTTPSTSPVVTEPVVTQPSVTQPVVSEPVAQPPTTPDIVTTTPSVTQPAPKTELQAEIDRIMRMAVGLETADLRYDVNKDGRVNSRDAYLVNAGQAKVPTAEEYASQQSASAPTVPSTTPQVTQPVDQTPATTAPSTGPATSTGVVLQNNGDGTALVLTNDGSATNVPATDAVSNEPLTPGSSVTINQNTNTATVTPPASDGGAQEPIVPAPPTVQDTGSQQVIGGGQQPTTDAGSIIDTPIGPDTSTPTVPEPVVEEPVVQEPPPTLTPPPDVPTTPEELITESPQEPVVDKTEEDILLEQIIRELEPTPPEDLPVAGTELPEEPTVLPETPVTNINDRLTIRPVVDRGFNRPSVSPGSRVEESAQILPIRPGLSEGGTGGIEGTTEQEQEPVWNVRSLKLRRLLGI